MLFLRSLLFSTGMIVTTGLVGFFVLLSAPCKFETRYAISKLWTRFNIWWLRFTCDIGYEISGLEWFPDQAVIIMSKHQSTWETIFFHKYFPPLTWVIKRELIYIPMFGWSLALLEPIAIDRQSKKTAINQILEQGKHYLDLGRWVLIFPEGTRTMPGEKRRYRIGGARLAVYSKYPILPVAHNAGNFWPRGKFIKRPGTVKIMFGPLIDSNDKTAEQLNAEVEECIETMMSQLSR